MSNLLNTAISGLKAQQSNLATTGHNIANANVEGYSRQDVVLSTKNAQFRGYGYIGSGVQISTVRRITDQFLVEQQRADTSSYQQEQAYLDNIEQIDALLASSSTGLQSILDSFFASLQGSADNPSYIPSRDVVLGTADSVVDRFRSIYKSLNDQNQTLNGQIATTVDEINALTEGIASLNASILDAQGRATTEPPNDLLDQRDELVRQLSELVEIEVTVDSDQYNIAFAEGNMLVLGDSANSLLAVPSAEDPQQTGVRFVSSLSNEFVTEKLTGGTLGGMIDFRKDALAPAMNQLGLIAVALSSEFNAQHSQGIDLNGNFGGDFFQDLNDPELAGNNNRIQGNGENQPPVNQVMSVYFDDIGQLTTSDYTIEFTGPDSDSYEVIRNSDGQKVDGGTIDGGNLPTEISFDGLRIVLEDGNFKAGDKFTVKPLRNVADQMDLKITESAELAFGYPMRGGASLGNQGTGSIDQGTMLSADGKAFDVPGQLSPPMVVIFHDERTYSVLDNSDPGNPVPLDPPMEYLNFVPGTSNTIFTDDPGETMISSWRPRLPTSATITPDGTSSSPPYNGINSERFTFSRTDPVTGEVTEDKTVITPTGASAADIAATLNEIDGVSANAYTQVQLSNFTNSGTPYDPDNPFEIWVNGYEITLDDLGPSQTIFEDGYPEEMPDQLTPDFLADRINAHIDLGDAGITAKSDGVTLTITDANGDDIFIEMRGDKPDPAIVGTPPLGTPPPNNSIDPGDTFEISTGEQWPVTEIEGQTGGKLNNLSGFDFSEDGPYRYELYLPDGRTGTIELTGTHATADDVKAEIESKITALLDSPGRAEASISPEGTISYKVFMKVEGTGNYDTAGVNVGGQVDVTMADGISVDTTPKAGAIFTGVSEAKPTYQGFQFAISGRPVEGDSFDIEWNEDGISDNRNVLDIVGLESADTINERQGGMTFTEAYSQAVETIGTKTNQAQIRTNAAEAVLEGTESDLNSIRGVNLDEEAALLIEFQLAYQANAQVISIAQQVFDSLIGAFR
ncbi:flagellar hook-associated protein FlgK [Saccharospirillum sp. MSK14-1]|uniref:flagellar hook-associated protein FlgK n=1 Tax=Saccharospirillum sp. MSK14-1 TaxID=1897632 RepID=UPI000D3674EB|nr:flagellar hook-associated protein FlgK [Saccharospirillum sp. MSK14-1]PTY36783.1 flagellar hook-associated protein FlgK [Saccharospirillum sp. MSK14-1]